MNALPLSSIEDAIGNTPLVRVSRLSPREKPSLFVKCEFMNPGGSIKDRIGSYIISKAEEAGLIGRNKTIVEATAGNTGMALALAAASRGYKLVSVMTTKASSEKVSALRAFGAEVIVVPCNVSPDDPEHFVNLARSIARERGAYYVDQFANSLNTEAHSVRTGPELWRQVGQDLVAFVCGVGTGGTMTGVGRFLKRMCSDIKIVVADPQGSCHWATWNGLSAVSHSYLVEGIGGDFTPQNADFSLVDVMYKVSDRQAAEAMLSLFRNEGIFAGSSAGAILCAAQRYCEDFPSSGKVVALLPDGGRAYLSSFYDSDWRSTHIGAQ